MDITRIDKNFDTSFQAPSDIKWFSGEEEPFSTHGVFYSNEEGLYRRLPKSVADAVNEGVSHLSKHTAGGRIRFATNSPFVAVRLEEPFEPPFSHMTIAGKNGVSIFTDDRFLGTVMPSYQDMVKADTAQGGTGIIQFDGIKYACEITKNVYQVELILPLYSAVKKVYIGLQSGSVLQRPNDYKYSKPILFYGSSITQGACASKPGDDYISRLSRMLDTDFINLGFSGSAKAEKTMAEYIASQNPSVFVLDYDHNAPTTEFLRETHYPLYETVRKAHPDTPIIFTTMPTIESYEERPWYKERRKEIYESYSRMQATGDKNVYLVDLYGCFGAFEKGECGTVDDCHPNSLGFLRMTEKIYPLLCELLNCD